LIVRKNNIQEALPLAEKAHELAITNPNISDTLGWINHLAGQDDKATKLLDEASKAAAENAEIHLHLAVASGATGNKPAAGAALKRALEIDPKLEQNKEVE
jgi:tetratricopeptide (TPR) repeat protein